MKKINFKKYGLVFVLIVIVIVLSILKLLYANKGEQIVIQSPTPIPTVAVKKAVNKNYPLESELPYQGNGFLIEKYVAPMTLNLKLTTATQQQAAKDITVWLDSFGEAGSGHIVEIEEMLATPSATKKVIPTPTVKN